MDFLSEWAVKIAREVAPQEIDRAPYVAANFVRGGRHRKKLFKDRGGSEAGGAGLNDIGTIFPHVLSAIQAAAPFIYSILASGAISSSIDLGKLAQDTYAAVQKKRQQTAPTQPASGPTQVNQIAILLEPGVVVISQGLQGAGLNVNESDQKSVNIMITIIRDPQGGKDFLDKLTEKK